MVMFPLPLLKFCDKDYEIYNFRAQFYDPLDIHKTSKQLTILHKNAFRVHLLPYLQFK